MPERLIISRLIASIGTLTEEKMRDPKRMLNQDQKNSWTDVIGQLSETPMGFGCLIPHYRLSLITYFAAFDL